MEDIASLKVADLKRELKERGLACTGAKNELLQRLQEALNSEKPTSDDSAMDDVLLDEDSMLAGEDDDSSGAEVETSDNEVSLNQSVDSTSNIGQSSPQKQSLTVVAVSPVVAAVVRTTPLSPIKKRNGTVPDGVNDGESAAKKLKINREPVQPLPPKKVAPATSPTKVPITIAATTTAANSSDPGSDSAKVNIKAVTTILSAADRAKLRQQKFAAELASNGGNVPVSSDKLQQRAARFGIAAPATGGGVTAGSKTTASAPLTAEQQGRLTKRRERFGKELQDTKEVVAEAKEKRAQRFSGSAVSTGSASVPDDKKKSRAARFGM